MSGLKGFRASAARWPPTPQVRPDDITAESRSRRSRMSRKARRRRRRTRGSSRRRCSSSIASAAAPVLAVCKNHVNLVVVAACDSIYVKHSHLSCLRSCGTSGCVIQEMIR